MKFLIITTLLIALLLLSGCTTYHVSTQSLLEQFANTQPERKVTVFIAFPIIFPGIVTGNSLRSINVLDKKEQEHTINVTRSTGIRVTQKDGKRKTFYFNTLLIKDSILTGKYDHFIGVNIKPINLNDIEKIEIQR